MILAYSFSVVVMEIQQEQGYFLCCCWQGPLPQNLKE